MILEHKQPKIPLKPIKKVDKSDKKKYNKTSNPACQEKEVVNVAASCDKNIKGLLFDDKGTWAIRAKVFDPVSGKVKLKLKSTGLKVRDRTKRKAEAMIPGVVSVWQKELEDKIKALQEPPRQDQTFGDCVQKWLDGKGVTVRPNSLKSYEDYAKTHILPTLGGYKVKDITWRVLQDFYNRLLTDHTVSSVKKINVVVRGALDDAIRDGEIDSNPTSLVRWPKRERYESRAFGKQDAARLLEAAEQAGEPMHSAIMLLCHNLARQKAK